VALRGHCAARLPGAAVPGTVEFVDHALPRTPAGNVDRRTLGAVRERVQYVD
jgi:acyl-CoA synthetase (AMP-forming)/AMP-acid ligase II